MAFIKVSTVVHAPPRTSALSLENIISSGAERAGDANDGSGRAVAVRRSRPAPRSTWCRAVHGWLAAVRIAVPRCVRTILPAQAVRDAWPLPQALVPHSPHVRARADHQVLPGQAGHGYPHRTRRWLPAAYRSGTHGPGIHVAQHLCCGTTQRHGPADESTPGAQKPRECEASSRPADGERSGQWGVQLLPGQPEPSGQIG